MLEVLAILLQELLNVLLVLSLVVIVMTVKGS